MNRARWSSMILHKEKVLDIIHVEIRWHGYFGKFRQLDFLLAPIRVSFDVGLYFCLATVAWSLVASFGSKPSYIWALSEKEGRSLVSPPLLLRGTEASFIGSTDLCDYLDFVIVPGKEIDFSIFCLMTSGRGIRRLNLRAIEAQFKCAHLSCKYRKESELWFSRKAEDVSLELDLPLTWQGYLNTLTKNSGMK